jgi:hypothetical protein
MFRNSRMAHSRTVLMLTLCGALLVSGPVSAQKTKASRIGWISDQACGAQHTKTGGADCVQKCWRGGASVGHPEWKPQPAVFIADDDHAVWHIDNPEAVKQFPASHVVLSGKFNSAKKTIHVAEIAPAT